MAETTGFLKADMLDLKMAVKKDYSMAVAKAVCLVLEMADLMAGLKVAKTVVTKDGSKVVEKVEKLAYSKVAMRVSKMGEMMVE